MLHVCWFSFCWFSFCLFVCLFVCLVNAPDNISQISKTPTGVDRPCLMDHQVLSSSSSTCHAWLSPQLSSSCSPQRKPSKPGVWSDCKPFGSIWNLQLGLFSNYTRYVHCPLRQLQKDQQFVSLHWDKIGLWYVQIILKVALWYVKPFWKTMKKTHVNPCRTSKKPLDRYRSVPLMSSTSSLRRAVAESKSLKTARQMDLQSPGKINKILVLWWFYSIVL